jgi:hypothetical protein
MKIGKHKIRPEIEEWKYWLHLVVIAIIVLGILQLWKGGSMLTFYNVLISTGLIGIADVFSHTGLGLD